MKREDDQNLEEPDKKIEEMHRDDMDMGTQNSRVGARYVLEEERRVLTFLPLSFLPREFFSFFEWRPKIVVEGHGCFHESWTWESTIFASGTQSKKARKSRVSDS